MKKHLVILFILLTISVVSQEEKFGKISKEELEEKMHPTDSTADAAYLYKKRKSYFYYDMNDGFVVVNEYHERIKIYTKEGFDYATKIINYYTPESGDKEKVTEIKAYTFNLENNEIEKQKLSSKDIFEERTSKYRTQKKLSLPSIKEGSVVELKYKITSPYWTIPKLTLQYNIPIKHIDYTVKIPEYFVFNKRSKGYFSIPIKESSDSESINFTSKERYSNGRGTTFNNNRHTYINKVYTIESKNIDAMKDNEPYSGAINNYRGSLEFELAGTRFPNATYKDYSTTWEDVCKRIFNSSDFGDQLKKHGYFEDDITTLLQDATNDVEKIGRIYHFVKQKVKWNDYYGYFVEKGTKKAYKEGTGNIAEINLMLTAMLRYAGFNANPVLVSTRTHGIPLFPTSNGYNYVISKVNFPDNSYVLLDASEEYSLPNILPKHCLNWEGRELFDNNSSQLVSLVPKKHSNESNTLYIKLNDDFGIDGMLRTTYSDYFSMFYKDKYGKKNEDELISELENKYNVEIEDFKAPDRKIASDNTYQSFKFNSSDMVEEISGKYYLTPLLFLAEKENPFKANERNFPIDFVLPMEQKHSVSLSIPDGYTITSVPENLAIGLPNNLGVFKYQITHNSGKVRLVTQFQINTNIISPEYYQTIKDFYKQLVAKQNEKIVIEKQ